jgi:hypothetical protein
MMMARDNYKETFNDENTNSMSSFARASNPKERAREISKIRKQRQASTLHS